MPMLEFGRTWRARVQRRLMKARARCWDTCFLRLVSMISRHWRTISTPSLVAPKTGDIPFRAVLTTFSLCNFTELQKNQRWTAAPVPNHFPNQQSSTILLKVWTGLYHISSQFQKFSLSKSYIRLNTDGWHRQASIS